MTKQDAVEVAIKTIDEVVNATRKSPMSLEWTTTISDLITTQERLKALMREWDWDHWLNN